MDISIILCYNYRVIYFPEVSMLEIKMLKPAEPYGSNCYLLSSCGEYAVIDPSADYLEALKQYPEIKGKIKYVLITHGHFDHILSINDWAKNADDVKIGDEDALSLADSVLNCYLGFLGIDDGYYGAYSTVMDGEILKLGDNEITVVSCPGHTKGGVSYMVENSVFCGDTVFAGGGYGRCDLPGGDISVLEKTIIKLITHMPAETVFYPGHGQQTKLQDLIYNFM